MSPAEYFTYLFYSWEARGRGWQVYEEPVCLEPPFIPFIRYFPRNGYIDESKRPTLISSFIDSLKGKKHAVNDDLEILDYDIVEPYIYEAPNDLKALQIKVPKQRKITPESTRALLTMISNTQFIVSFEIFGNPNEINIQFVCNSSDISIVQTYIKAYFPSYSIIANDKYLEVLPRDRETHVVDFGLNEEFVRPISIFKSSEIDPLTSIIAILDNLDGDDFAGIQILFQGTQNKWSQSIIHSVTLNDGKSFFQDVPEAPKLALEKISSPLFGVSIRAFSQEGKNKTNIIESISQAIIQSSRGQYNQLALLNSEQYSGIDKISDVYLRESHRLGMILSADELATFVHFPTDTIVSKKLFYSLRKTVDVPSIAKGKKTILGQNNFNSQLTNVTFGVDDRLKHTHVIGATGTGKSTLLANKILQDIEQGLGIALFDPHGDLVDDVIARLPENCLNRIVIIDPSDTEFPIGLNLLHAHNDLEKEVLSSDLVASFRRLSTSWGDQMNTVFANAILAILESKNGGTLNDLRRFLVEPNFRSSYLKSIEDPSILYYWLKEYPLLKTNSIGPILTRLDTFLRPRIIRNMVSQKTGLDFEEILNENKILFIKLPQGLIGKENSFLLGSLILSKLHQAAFARQSKQIRPPFFIYLDEFHNFITPSIKEMLSGVRKYNVGLILAHQDLQQLQREDTELLNSVLGNTYTRIVFRVGEPDAKRLQDGFADFEFIDMQNLGRGEAIMRIEQPKYNTSFDTFSLSEIDSESKERLYVIALNISRSKYAKPKEEIEKEILSSLELVEGEIYIRKETKVPNQKKEPVSNTEKFAKHPTIDDLEIVSLKEVIPDIIKPKETTTHRYLQNLIKKMAESYGYVATLEAVILGDDGNIDVVLQKDLKTIAIEICVSTDSDWEVHNIEKCVKASYDTVVSLSGDIKQLDKIKRKFTEKMPEISNVHFMTPDALFDYLRKDINTNQPSTDITMKGYRIKVAYDSVSHSEMTNKKSAIASVIMNSIKKKNS